jgi:hypothetical protein
LLPLDNTGIPERIAKSAINPNIGTYLIFILQKILLPRYKEFDYS